MKTYLMTTAERKHFDPQKLTDNLKAAGFRFDEDTCPVRIKKPWDAIENEDGSFTYRQWDVS